MKKQSPPKIPSARLVAGVLIVALLAVCAGWIYWRQTAPLPTHPVAEIWVDGTLYRRIDLSATPDTTFSIAADTGKPVSFQVKDGAIRFVDVTCPNHTCEKTGFVHWDGQTAVCMPNRVSVTVTTE